MASLKTVIKTDTAALFIAHFPLLSYITHNAI